MLPREQGRIGAEPRAGQGLRRVVTVLVSVMVAVLLFLAGYGAYVRLVIAK